MRIFKRAGQPDVAEMPRNMPAQAFVHKSHTQELAEEIQRLRAENQRLKDEQRDTSTLESVRDYLKRVRVFDDVTTVVTDLRYIIGEK